MRMEPRGDVTVAGTGDTDFLRLPPGLVTLLVGLYEMRSWFVSVVVFPACSKVLKCFSVYLSLCFR
jgi:hypothetical protein